MVRRLVAKPKHRNRTGTELWNPGTPSAVGLKSRVNNGISSLNSDVPVRTNLPPHFHYFVKAKLFVVSTISAS
jgi:hypothetical protein